MATIRGIYKHFEGTDAQCSGIQLTRELTWANNIGPSGVLRYLDCSGNHYYIYPGLSLFTSGSVLFASASGLPTEDNSNFFWDSINKRLGVGTNNPLALLHVSGLIYTDQLRTNRGPGNSYGYLTINQGNTGNTGYVEWRNASGVRYGYIGFDNDSTPRLSILLENSGFLNIRDGNVRIGSSLDAGYKLDVDGATILRDTLLVSGTLELGTVNDASLDTDKFLVLNSSGIVSYRTGTELLSDIGAVAGSGGLLTEDRVLFGAADGSVEQSSSLTFNGTFLYSEKDISIYYTSPPTLNANYCGLNIGRGSVLYGSKSVASLTITSNSYYSVAPSAADKYISNGYATKIDNYAGTISFLNAQSGTAGTNISWNLGLYLVGSTGRMGYRTSNPSELVEIIDAGSTDGFLLKLTQDDQNVKGLAIGNDTSSTTDTNSLQLYMENNGSGVINSYSGIILAVAGSGALKINSDTSITLDTVNNAGYNTDKILVLDASGNVDYRTSTELANDIGLDYFFPITGTIYNDYSDTMTMSGVYFSGPSGIFDFIKIGSGYFFGDASGNIRINTAKSLSTGYTNISEIGLQLYDVGYDSYNEFYFRGRNHGAGTYKNFRVITTAGGDYNGCLSVKIPRYNDGVVLYSATYANETGYWNGDYGDITNEDLRSLGLVGNGIYITNYASGIMQFGNINNLFALGTGASLSARTLDLIVSGDFNSNVSGNILLNTLPTSDPAVANAIWLSGRYLMVSAG